MFSLNHILEKGSLRDDSEEKVISNYVSKNIMKKS